MNTSPAFAAPIWLALPDEADELRVKVRKLEQALDDQALRLSVVAAMFRTDRWWCHAGLLAEGKLTAQEAVELVRRYAVMPDDRQTVNAIELVTGDAVRRMVE